MTIQEALNEYLERISDAMVNNLFNNRSVKTGDLARSIKKNNTVEETTDGYKATLTMNWYGEVVDSGVYGSTNNKVQANPRSENAPGQFKSKAIAPSSGLPTPVRFAIAQRGFAAKPFIKDSIQSVKSQFGDALITKAGTDIFTEQLTTAFENSTK